ncbi:unnamed protein product [Didymodactylos carnosus]|nr:unnamed protein product [Didymodactylos carnosus]CAF4197493.1 unnamed protein product [Didymodactylos carnosus]
MLNLKINSLFSIVYSAHTDTSLAPFVCPVPLINATWNQKGVFLVNRANGCNSNENSLCEPRDLFIDNVNDNLYVADTRNNRIQKYSLIAPIDNGQGTIGITVASQGLIAPQSIFVDTRTDDMYILDYDKYEIKDLSEPAVYRVQLWHKNDKIGRILLSEKGEYGFGTYFSYLTLDKYMNIYVGTRFYIRKWLSSTNYSEKVLAAGNSELGGRGPNNLFNPCAFYIYNDLTLYIVDLSNHRIQKWLANATEGTTLVENLIYAVGITADCNGNIYYTDTYDQAIFQYNIINNQRRMIVGDEHRLDKLETFFPLAIKIDKFGNIYVTTSAASQIMKFSIL